MLSVHKNVQYTLNFHQSTKTFGLESINKIFQGQDIISREKMSDNILETPWKNGVWISDLNSATIFKVNGQDVER